MEKDRFDEKIILLEHKIFEAGIAMSDIVLELLASFPDMGCEIEVQVPYNDYEKGLVSVDLEYVFFDAETGLVNIKCCNADKPCQWDDFDFSSKEIIMHEIHHRYKSGIMFRKLSSPDKAEGDIH